MILNVSNDASTSLYPHFFGHTQRPAVAELVPPLKSFDRNTSLLVRFGEGVGPLNKEKMGYQPKKLLFCTSGVLHRGPKPI
jgi:hypothetical protein